MNSFCARANNCHRETIWFKTKCSTVLTHQGVESIGNFFILVWTFNYLFKQEANKNKLRRRTDSTVRNKQNDFACHTTCTSKPHQFCMLFPYVTQFAASRKVLKRFDVFLLRRARHGLALFLDESWKTPFTLDIPVPKASQKRVARN